MSSYVISILNPKGGAGKTTTCINLARGLQLHSSEDVLIIDLDEQGSSTDWRSVEGIEYDYPEVITIDSKNLIKSVDKLRKIYRYILLDGKGNLEAHSLVPALKSSDLVIMPVQPSGFDMWATEPLVDILHHRREITDGTPEACFLISQNKTGTIIGREIRGELDKLGLATLDGMTHNRVEYKESATRGITVYEHSKKAGREEFAGIVREVLGIESGAKKLEHPVTEVEE